MSHGLNPCRSLVKGHIADSLSPGSEWKKYLDNVYFEQLVERDRSMIEDSYRLSNFCGPFHNKGQGELCVVTVQKQALHEPRLPLAEMMEFVASSVLWCQSLSRNHDALDPRDC